MLPQSENCGFPIVAEITTNSLKDSQTIMEAMGQDVDIGLLPRN
jgi:hypothetical protein